MSTDYMALAAKLYHQPDADCWWAPSDYTPIINALGTVLVRHDDDDYQGDTFALVRNEAGLLGLVNIGWGSCCGCDALQACNNDTDLAKLIETIYAGVEWKTLDDMRAYFQAHDWEGGYGWSGGCQQAFVAEAKQVLESL